MIFNYKQLQPQKMDMGHMGLSKNGGIKPTYGVSKKVVGPLLWLNLAFLQEDRHEYHARNCHTKGVQVG
jgi:hypothetical protein